MMTDSDSLLDSFWTGAFYGILIGVYIGFFGLGLYELGTPQDVIPLTVGSLAVGIEIMWIEYGRTTLPSFIIYYLGTVGIVHLISWVMG